MRINQPIDPFLKRRVRITGNSNFITKWLFMLVIIAIICSGIYISSDIVKSLIISQKKSLNTVPNNTLNSSQGINYTDISEKVLTDDSATNLSQITFTSDTIQVPVKSEIKPMAEIEPVVSLKTLLNKANKQIAMKRFTSPKGNNAYETYKIILKKSPQKAEEILDNIVAWYFTQGEKFIDKNRLTTKLNRRGSAYKMYQKLSEIAPNHKNTNKLLKIIITKLDKRAREQLSDDKSIDNTYITYQEMFKIVPNNLKAKQLLTDITNNLFVKAKKQIDKQQYSTPKNNNAADTFKHILAIAPDDIRAKKGLKKIVKKYYGLALRRYNQGRYKGSMTWLERGLQVSYNDPELNDLKKQISEKVK